MNNLVGHFRFILHFKYYYDLLIKNIKEIRKFI